MADTPLTEHQTKVRYYNEVRFLHFGDTQFSPWEPACHGHKTLEDAIECNERALHRVGHLIDEVDKLILLITKATHKSIEARIVKRTAVITTEVMEEPTVLVGHRPQVGPQAEPEVRGGTPGRWRKKRLFRP